MADCGCGGSSNKAAAKGRAAARQAPAAAAQNQPREGGPQDRGSSYYSRAGRYTGPPAQKQ
jgi:hypothetical protein